tara:strand:+ start:40 stop:297 length:258 start_codon:yes stop_codon:yes gene_type:complete
MELCPIQCINTGCVEDSFLEKNQTFLLTIFGLGGSAIGILLSYFLKSRCRKIGLCWGCLTCDRTVLELPIESVNVESINVNSSIA